MLRRLSIWAEKCANRPYLTLSVLFGLCLVVFIATLWVPRVDGLLIGSDGVFYYANLRSLFFDHDLHLSNDYFGLLGFVPEGFDTPLYPVGMALVWLPFYTLAHGMVWLFHTLGAPSEPDGFGWSYQIAVCLGSMIYGYLGMLLVFRLCREFFSPLIALSSTLLIWFGWNILYYMVFENSMAHCTSLLLITGLIVWERLEQKRHFVIYWAVQGCLIGLATMVRPQDGAFAVLPAMILLLQLWEALRQRSGREAVQVVLHGLIFVVTALLTFAPQLAASQVAYGRLLISGQMVKGETFDWTSPQLFSVLFSTWHGLFTWHPLILLAVVGLGLLARSYPFYILQLAVAFLVQLYIVASWNHWWQGDAFGGRVFISCGAIFALGLAAVLDYLHKRFGIWTLLAIGLLTLGWNGLFIVQYRLGFISKSDPLSWRELTIDKLTFLFSRKR